MNTDDSGAGSLRAAIEQANVDAAQDTIAFAPSVTGTISLSTALPDLSAGMNIVGPGPSALTVTRSGADGTPLFGIVTVSSGARVAISGLTITGGHASLSGGGIGNFGTLSIANDIISGNSAGLGPNYTGTPGIGGGIDNAGTLSITDSTISGNTATSVFSVFPGLGAPGVGGGINNTGSLLMADSTISGNSGGGINNTGSLSMADATISGNSGGGINNTGSLSVADSTFSGNSAAFGGGIANSGTVTAVCSTFNGNTAVGYFAFRVGQVPGQGGGIINSGTLSVTYSTFSGNSASVGGGIYNSDKASIVDTIVAGNTVNGSSAASDIGGDVTGSYNLIGTGGSGGLKNGKNGNIVLKTITGLGLAPLADNGGLTQTMALLPGSPAIGVGIAVSGVTTDQRGITRPSSHPDIGAFEIALSSADPMVVSLQRFGVHDQPTLLVLTFNEPMDATRADNRANYRLVWASPAQRNGAKHDRAIPIRYARYNAAAQTVTIRPIHRLPLRRHFLLKVVGTPPGGLTNTSGIFLDGAGTGQPGSDYRGIVNRKSLAGQVGRN